MNSKSLQRML